MPASYALLCAFIGEHRGKKSGKCIKGWLSGIRSWHQVNHAPWYGDDEWIKMARVTANKEGTAHKRPLRAPVSIEHLLVLRKAIDTQNPFHAAIWAVALCTFFGCRRLGETVVTNEGAFDGKYNVLRSTQYESYILNFSLFPLTCNRIIFRTLRGNVRTSSFHIPWTKTTKEQGAEVILTGRPDLLCPVDALKNHLNINHRVSTSSALFAHTTASGDSKNLTKSMFLSFVTNVWKAATLAHVLGHSFRIGGAVELLLAGVPPEIVAATGGWTSLAFLLYWRRMDEILPLSTSKAYNRSHFEDLAKIFEDFRHRNNTV